MAGHHEIVAIVDHPDSPHGRLMHASARLEAGAPAIRWIPPSLDLPETLAALDGVDAVAIPLAVRGATPRDRFTRRLMDAIRSLMQRKIPVFVAAGNRRPNLLAEAGIAVTVAMCPGSAGTSDACVRVAIHAVRRNEAAPIPQPRAAAAARRPARAGGSAAAIPAAPRRAVRRRVAGL